MIEMLEQGVDSFELMDAVSRLDADTRKQLVDHYTDYFSEEELALMDQTSQLLEQYYQAVLSQNRAEQQRLEKLFKANYKKL